MQIYQVIVTHAIMDFIIIIVNLYVYVYLIYSNLILLIEILQILQYLIIKFEKNIYI